MYKTKDLQAEHGDYGERIWRCFVFEHCYRHHWKFAMKFPRNQLPETTTSCSNYKFPFEERRVCSSSYWIWEIDNFSNYSEYLLANGSLWLIWFNYPLKPVLLLIWPLLSLIKSHIQELNDHGISCVWLSDDDANENAILNGEFSIVFTSPEAIIKKKKWREMLGGKIYQKNLFGIVTDEVHVIPKW